MAYFPLSGITGCVEPASGGTAPSMYGVMYNTDKIVSYYKKDIGPCSNNNFTDTYFVIIIFENYTQNYQFLTSANRDTFYTSLPS